MPKLFFASLVTISLLLSLAAGVIIAAMLALGTLDLGAALIATVVINGIFFVLSPWITDLSLKWINKLTWLDAEEVKSRYPHVAALIHKVARDKGFTPPYIGYIADRNPTAFTYGLLRSRARIVVTEGLFEFLNEDEQKAVVAHELGHIVNRDFLVMTIAGLLVQVMYQVYAAMNRAANRSGGKSEGKSMAFTVAVAAYIAYVIGTYVLLYLSRTREYLADAYAAEHVEARHLASALVKVAYGIAVAADSDQTRELLGSTRHLGVVDFRSSRYLGLIESETSARPETTAEAMLFDAYNPWAKLIELSSTHPLTGRRIEALGAIAKSKHQTFEGYDVAAAARRVKLDQAALRRQFWSEASLFLYPVAFCALPIAAAFILNMPEVLVLLLPAAWLGWIATIPQRFPSTAPEPARVAELMADWRASPLIGRPVKLEGAVIGRADAGSVVSEDTIFADTTGRTVLDFRSMAGAIGDLWTGWRRIAPHISQRGEAEGWFVRGMGGHVIMKRLETRAGLITAYPQLAGILGPIAVLLAFGAVALAIYIIEQAA